MSEVLLTKCDYWVRVEYGGDNTFPALVGLFDKLSHFCEAHRCYSVLGLSRSTAPLSSSMAFKIDGIFRHFKIDERYHFAWVEYRESSMGSIRYAAEYLKGKGVCCEVFTDERCAGVWLKQQLQS
ncbi:hypothetical protein [Agaribacterium sp. ZY112]|uniref:hypothetical protein n=1 Tax=Agaribacterium sp. ZY112 TaxID=3233574 RepID=UPI00352392E7